MGNKMKKLICSLLAAAMLVSSVGIAAFAAPEDENTAAETTVTATDDSSTADLSDEEKEAAEDEQEAADTTEEADDTAVPTDAPVVTTTSSSGTSYDNDSYYQKALALSSSLGIISGYEDGSVRPDSKVTRAEMASIVLRLLALPATSTYQNIFTDVSSSHWAAGQIQSAYEANIINGMGDGTFAPDSEVTYAQVIVMLVNAMNYQDDAEYYGGWQQGYIKEAGELGLLKSAPGEADVASDRGVVIKMVYNALLGDYREIRSYKNGYAEYEVNDDHPSLAYAKFDLIDQKGVLLGTEKTTISNKDLQEGQIEFLADKADESEVFDTVLTGLEDYIAQKVTYYYRENSGLTPEVLAVTYDASKSETYEISDPDDIERVEGFETKNGKIKVSGVSKTKDCENAIIVYNGKVLSDVQLEEIGDDINDLLIPEVGSLKLVKSDKSSDVYDVIFVDSYDTVIVSSVGTERLTGKISDATSDDIGATKAYSLNLDDSEDRTVTVTKAGQEIRLRNLKKNDVASIRASYDNTVVDIIVTGESITGTASGVSKKLDDSHATVNGTRYEVANIAVDDLKTGSQAVFYFDAFDRIAYIEASTASGQLQSGEKYGWIMNAYEADNGDDYVVQIMTSDGKAVEFNAGTSLDYWAPNATSNTTLKGDDVADTISALISGNSFIKDSKTSTPIRLVKYKTNSANTLSRLYCSVNSTVVSNEDALRIDPTDLASVAVVSNLVSGYKINDGILEISVPKNVADMKDADNYKFGTVNASSYVVRENGSSRNYVVGEFDNSTPSVLIYFTSSADALADLGDIDTNGNNPVMLVEEIDSGVDDDDNEIYTVHGYVNGAEASFTTTKNTVLGKINTSSAIINSARDYATTALWDAKNGAADKSGKTFTDIVQEGDLILYDGGERLIQLLDADDVYNVVVNGASTSGLLFGAFSPFIARNMFAVGALLESDIDSEARIVIDASSNYISGTVEFDTAKLMDTVEISNRNGRADVDTEGSEISDLELYDAASKTGDYVFVRFADKGTVQEIIIYRFVN